MTFFNSEKLLLSISTLGLSIIYDFIVKSSGRTDFYGDELLDLPIIKSSQALSRGMGLICINDCYKPLWERNWKNSFKLDSWTSKNSNILNKDYFDNITKEWNPEKNGLKTEFERRQSQLEIDVIISINSGLNLAELLSIYKNTFRRLFEYEGRTFYDISGRAVYGPNTIYGIPKKANKDLLFIEYPDGTTEAKPLGWEDICPDPAPTTSNGRRENYASGQSYGKPKIPDGTKIHRTVMDDTLPGGPREKTITYIAPFYLPDREEDYRVAWDVFSKRFASTEELSHD